MFPRDPEVWLTRFAPVGKFKESLAEGYKGETASFWTPQREQEWKSMMLKPENGFTGPTCWYKVMVRDIEAEDAKRE